MLLPLLINLNMFGPLVPPVPVVPAISGSGGVVYHHHRLSTAYLQRRVVEEELKQQFHAQALREDDEILAILRTVYL